jgi:EAL domain-containing protein (putative c-di-GMP-specific phosphodiesterase class I)
MLMFDRRFVEGVYWVPHNAEICGSIVGLAKSLGLGVIAEGVETQAQLDWLRAHGCGQAQGYLLAKPAPFEEMLAKLAR